MRLVRRVLVAGAVAALVSQPAYAGAEVVTRADAIGDVARSPIGSSAYAPVPTRVEGDITSIRVRHARRTIRIDIRLRDLSTTNNGNFHRIAIKSNRRYRSIAIDAFPTHWAGRLVTTTAGGVVVGCSVRHLIDYVGNVVTIRVPRVCLRRPDWVRVSARTTVAGAKYAFADDAAARGYVAGLVFGPRVRR
jgi:hypothetical protein